ncbi:MAG: hypothetical protein ACJ789_16690 [Thermomicrobiales bacterium]
MEFEILIANGTVVDGSADATARVAEVGITGDELFNSPRTVQTRLNNVYGELGVTGRSEAIVFALE